MEQTAGKGLYLFSAANAACAATAVKQMVHHLSIVVLRQRTKAPMMSITASECQLVQSAQTDTPASGYQNPNILQ